MNESEVKSKILKHFEDKGYHTLKEFELNCVNKMLKVDVIAFKWLSEYDIEAIAVECKGNVGIHTLIDTVYSQLREYQTGFPRVYLAVPESIGKVPKDLLESYGIGLLTVNNEEIKEKLPPNSEKSAPKFDLSVYGYSVRQKLVAYMTLYEITKEELKYTHERNFGFGCWVDEFCNYCIYNDVFFSREYHLSIVIDKQENVMKALKRMNPQELYELLKNLPGDFLFSVYQVFVAGRGLRSYKPVLRIPIEDLNRKFLDWLVEFAKNNNWKTPINIGRKIWNLDEFLPKSEHLRRAQEVKEYLEPVKSYFEKL